jgi:putative heme transporter
MPQSTDETRPIGTQAAREMPGAEAPAEGAPRSNRPWDTPVALRRLGLAAWLSLGIIAVVALAVALIGLAAGIVVPFFFAALFGAVMFPLVDRLERWHVPRWVAALLMVVLAIVLMAVMMLVVVDAFVQQWPDITANLDQAVAEIREWMAAHGVDTPSQDDIRTAAQSVVAALGGGVASSVGGAVSSIAQLGFGIFVALNILFWIEKDGRTIGRWAGSHMGLPHDVGVQIVKDGVRALRRYFYGVSAIALLNGVVVWAGAAVIGVPLALAIGLVTFVFAYIPYFGAIIGGAFAVLIALGSGGPSAAAAMLVVVILANGPIQNVAQQFVLGDALEMHPLSIIIITTTGGILGGALGSMVAAPLVKVAVDARGTIAAAGVFADVAETEAREAPAEAIVADVGSLPPEEAEKTDGGPPLETPAVEPAR